MTRQFSYEGEVHPDMLRSRLVGRRIAEIDEQSDRLVLDDGTELMFEEGGDCCAYFHGDLSLINLSDNAITAIEVHDTEPAGDHEDVSWRATILSYDQPVATLDVNGYSSNGYYGSSINLRVKYPEASRAARG